MPLDAICLRALTNELKGQLLGARIDKVQQPARDQIVLLLRGNLRLLLNAGPNQPRVQLTEVLRENPTEPPMLCHAAAQAPRRRTHHGDRAERTGAHRDVHRPQRERVGRVRHEEAGA
ncbi:MAG: NFACT family protein [Oscillospiraceae bacterium]